MNLKDNVKLIFLIIIAVTVLGSYYKIPSSYITAIVSFLGSALVGLFLSATASKILEAFTGDILKKFLLKIDVFGFKFSITLFAIATLILRYSLFRM